MKHCITALTVIIALVINGASAFASDTEYHYVWNEGDVGPNYPDPATIDNDAGVLKLVSFSYDTAFEQLTVELRMAPPISFPDRFVQSFVLILSDGPHPDKGGGEYGVLYFDATRQNPVLTAYTYEPSDGWDSGSWATGDPLCTSLVPGSCGDWISALSVTENNDGSKSFFLSVNTSEINAHFPSNQNPNGRGWQGMQFDENIGFWLTPYGYPNMSFFYNGNGFISLLLPGQDPGIEYHGFFDDGHKKTFRNPFCQGPDFDNVFLSVGENFNATFTGKSPDGNPLTINYSGLPASAIVDPADGTTANDGMITANIDFTPTEADAETVFNFGVSVSDQNGDDFCSVQVIVGGNPDEPDPDCEGVPGGDAELDRCGVCEGDGQSCLGCDLTNILDFQFTMDNEALMLRRVLRRVTRAAFKQARGTSREAEIKAYRRTTNKRGKRIYQSAWTATWVFEQNIQTCTNTEFCVAISNVELLQDYVDQVDALFALNRDARKVLKSLGGGTNKFLRQARNAQTEALAAAGQIPTSSSSCS